MITLALARLYWLAACCDMDRESQGAVHYASVAVVASGFLLNAGVAAQLEPLLFVACVGLYGFLALGLGQVAEVKLYI